VIPAGPLTLAEYVQAASIRRQVPKTVLELAALSPGSRELVTILSSLGWMEPAAAWRPGVTDMVTEVEYEVTVPPAIRNADGTITNSEVLMLPVCAPLSRSIVIDILRVSAGNLTAAQSGRTKYKKVNLGGFGEFCLPFEPDDLCGRFANIEHIIVCPKAGFSVFAENCNPCSEAVFHLYARMWSAC